MKISAVYIAKNEAKNIARSLESVKDSVDELILVDTGSEDDTVKIFENYGGRVYHLSWQDDFSAPRNLALSKATGDWIIILDADEYFSEDTRRNVRAVIENASKEALGIVVNIVNYNSDRQTIQDRFYNLRIVKRQAGIHYRGRIHERLFLNDVVLGPTQMVDPSLLSIVHTGYRTGLSKVKAERNLRIIKEEISNGMPERDYYIYLADIYSALEEYDEAVRYAKLDIAEGRRNASYAGRPYRIVLKYYAEASNRPARLQRLEYAEIAVKAFPELPDFHAEYSEALNSWYRFEEAAEEARCAMECLSGYRGTEPCLLKSDAMPMLEKRRRLFLDLAEIEKSTKISACIIVKNEQDKISGWLENAAVFADEIIVIDTGSADRTVEIVREAMAANSVIKLFGFEWDNDFSAARNIAVDNASGDWIVFTDADERFYDPESVRGYLAWLGKYNPQLQVLMIPNANVDKDNGFRVINYYNPVRAFRRIEGLRYQGRIHECLSMNGADFSTFFTMVADDCMLMEHTGYSSSLTARKALRNIELLDMELQDGRPMASMLRYYADCHYALENYEQALSFSLQATQSAYQAIGQKGDMYWLAINAMEKLDYSLEDKMAVINAAIAELPELPDFYGRSGIALAEAGEYAKGAIMLNKALSLYDLYVADNVHKESSSFITIYGDVMAYMGHCLIRNGDRDRAGVFLNKAIEFNKWNDKAIAGLMELYDGQAPDKLMEAVTGIYGDNKVDMHLLCRILLRNGFLKEARLISEYAEGARLDEFSIFENIDKDAMYLSSMKELALIMPELFVCQLHDRDSNLDMLPEKMQRLARYFYGAPINVSDCFEEYNTMLSYVIDLATDEVKERYISLCADFSSEEAMQHKHIVFTASKLSKAGLYEKALELYQAIPADSESADGYFLQNVGIALYGLCRYEEAAECLRNAIQDNRTTSYMTWCQERLSDGD